MLSTFLRKFLVSKLRQFFTNFLVACLLFLSGCQSFKNKGSQPIVVEENSEKLEQESLKNSDQKDLQKNEISSPKKEKIFDMKKLGKELVSILTWDVVIAEICRNGLALAPAICVVADVSGDVAIILYHNKKTVEKDPKDLVKTEAKKSTDIAAKPDVAPVGDDVAGKKKEEKKTETKYEFKPLNLLIDVLIAVVVVALV